MSKTKAARPVGSAGHLDTLDRAKIEDALRSGTPPQEVARQFNRSGPTIYAIRAKMQKAGEVGKVYGQQIKTMEQGAIEALNADIQAGMSEDDIRAKHGIGGGALYRWKNKLRGELEAATPKPPPDKETIDKTIKLLVRLGDKHPEVFGELDILERLVKKHPMILLGLVF